MTTDVISNLTGSLDAELEQARATLREVDDGIKKLFGKENTAEGGSFGNNRFVRETVLKAKCLCKVMVLVLTFFEIIVVGVDLEGIVKIMATKAILMTETGEEGRMNLMSQSPKIKGSV